LRGLLLLRLPAALTPSFSPKSSDLSHMFSVFADGDSAFSAGLASFLGGKLMSVATLVSDLATLTGYLSLLFGIHRGKSPQSLCALLFSLCHTASSCIPSLARVE
jgi:hypothetical protein